MLTLDKTTLFFYSYILSTLNDDKPGLSKKCKSNISSWLNDVPATAPPPSWTPSLLSKNTAKTSHSATTIPSLTAGSTCSTTPSVLTVNIKISEKLPAPPICKSVEPPHMKVMENGAILDHDEVMGDEWDAAMASPEKAGRHVTSAVCICISSIILYSLLATSRP